MRIALAPLVLVDGEAAINDVIDDRAMALGISPWLLGS